MSRRTFAVVVTALVLIAALVTFRFWVSPTVLWAWSNGGQFLLPLVVVSALLDSLNPCAFAVLLLTLAFLFQIGRQRTQVLRIGAVYIAGVFAVYVLIGLGILQVLHLFNTPHFMAKVGAALLLALGLINLVNHFWPRFPLKLKIPAASHVAMGKLVDRASLPAAFLLGALVGLCEFPCTGGPYLMILGLLHDYSVSDLAYWQGIGYLLFYNVLFVAPLVLMLLLSASPEVLGRISGWQKTHAGKMRLYGGIAMVLLGLLIFFL